MNLSVLVFSIAALSRPVPAPVASTVQAGAAGSLEAQVQALFQESCSGCHDGSGPPQDPESIDLESPPSSLIGKKSVVNRRSLVVPGQPDASYLVAKMDQHAKFDGELMPPDDDPLSQAELDLVRNWVSELDPTPTAEPAAPEDKQPERTQPFFGVQHIALPTTSTLGKRVLQYRIDHRFGRIGTERGFFGLDVGAIMSFGLAYGLLPGWDIRLRRTNSYKGWELGSKYIFLRQEDGKPLSLGGYASFAYFHQKGVLNPFSGSFVAMLSRLWCEQWATMLTVSYHLHTNHAADPNLLSDDRGTLAVGLASSVRIGKRKRWSIDAEYIFPIPTGDNERGFYTRSISEAPDKINPGIWSIAGSLRTKMHQFQILVSNNREIHTSLAAPGGQTRNPFNAPDIPGRNPFRHLNFYVGFNLIRKFRL